MTYRSWFLSVVAALAVAFAVFVGIVAWAARVVRQPNFYNKIPDATMRVQESAFLLHDQKCDVLVYGDSTALTGVDPRVIIAGTGLSACNIAVTRPVVDVMGMYPLDRFLAHNAKPKYLLLQFGPELFYRAKNWDHVQGIAPLILLLRQEPGLATDWALLLHPTMTIQFAQTVLRYNFLESKSELTRFESVYKDTFSDYQANHGLLNYVEQPQTHCLLSVDAPYGPLDTNWIRGIRRKYEAQGMIVLVRAAPLPPCDPRVAWYRSSLAPVVDSNVQTLPVDSFNNGDRHLTRAAAAISTAEIVRMIRAKQGTL